MMTAFAFIVVFLAIQALKPSADLMGPATAGMRPPDRPQDNLTQTPESYRVGSGGRFRRVSLRSRTSTSRCCWASRGSFHARSAIGSSVPVGWPELVPLVVAAALVWPLALVRGTRTPAPKGALIFPLYLLLIAAQSALVYAVTREPSSTCFAMACWRCWRRLASARCCCSHGGCGACGWPRPSLLALLAGTAAIDHLRVIQEGYRGKPRSGFADAAARLDERGVRIGRSRGTGARMPSPS